MRARTFIRVAGVILVGMAVAATVFAIVAARDESRSMWVSTILGSNWFLVVVAIVSVAALVWVLTRGGDVDRPELTARGAVCRRCGGEVRADWRLCPHCGFTLQQGAGFVGTTADEAPTALSPFRQ
jgi:hypothetical protein